MVYKGIKNKYSISDIVVDNSRSCKVVPNHKGAAFRGVMTLEGYLPILRNLERSGGEVYYVRDGPDNTKIFGIEGRATLFMVPDPLYQEVRGEVPSVQYGGRMPLNIVMKNYRRMKRQRKK